MATRLKSAAALLAYLPFMAGCQNPAPIATVDYVDLERFSGDWYVIANIPTFAEEGAHNAVERYEITEDGRVATTFTFREDRFDGDEKALHATGFVNDGGTNAHWGMQFIWPIKAEYRIVYLDEDYSTTIVGRSMRDYVWIMARTPQIAEEEYKSLLDHVAQLGYNIDEIQKVPQRWQD